MPIVAVQSGLPSEEYAKLKVEMEMLGITSEYEIIQDILIVHLNQPKKARMEKILFMLNKAADFIIEDLKNTAGI